ncbi:MAG: beta-ketoacyl-ACP synthase II [Gemmatales bacterium]|nr:beta-ketoacyl-ACP synthase II [Gemmatales bacterium]MCS7160367.1 beta-ketoacyl-ACP synthase II [Gemmatales bacterium]MDW8175567.1 beta-ketoacyl-ACP synthase II [Gemmatales bacterium]MDW8221467.1 beta-ketoacyl-ACP synthase II [Gemmatales bacterium]
MAGRRVVITGLGTFTALGPDLMRDFWSGLLAGRSAISLIDLFDTSQFRVHFAGQIHNFQPEAYMEARLARRLDRYAQFALIAAMSALKDSGLEFVRAEDDQPGFYLPKEDPDRVGVVIGTGIGGLAEYEEQHSRLLKAGPDRISPLTIPKLMANAASGQISIYLRVTGPNIAVATACASSAHAIGEAFRMIQRSEADVIIAGGAEATITPMGLGGFIAARALSERNDAPEKASRPFDRDRDGFVLAEGAGVLILEEETHARRRGANIYAEILGYGATADAYNITAPHPEGAGAAKAMARALADARLNPDQIQYINAHGTSTPLGDAVETKAIKAVFREHARRLAISSTKSMLGHTLGAAGGIELIATALTVRYGVAHPTINYENPDPECDLDYIPNVAREMPVRYAISNSFGFGGHNACIVLGAYQG